MALLLQQFYFYFLSSLYRQGMLEQFIAIMILQDEGTPRFSSQLFPLFFQDFEKGLRDLANALDEEEVDYEKVSYAASLVSECSLCLGCQRMKDVSVTLKSCYKAEDLEGCLRCAQQLKDEYSLVKSKFQTLLMLEQQIVDAGCSLPIMENTSNEYLRSVM